MKSPILLLGVLLTIPILAQTEMPRPRVVPVPEPVQHDPRPVADPLRKNTTIRLQGTTTTGQDVDLSLTGLGPRFNADQMIAGNDTVMSCDYLVSETDRGFMVSYTLVVQVKAATSVNQGSTIYNYRDVSLKGTVLCKAGEPVVIVKNGDKSLQLTVTQNSEEPKK